MNKFQLACCAFIILVLLSVGGFNLWRSYQPLREQQAVSGTVLALTRNQVRSRGNSKQYGLEITLRNQPGIFRIPVRYEPAIPEVLQYVQPGDSITAFYGQRALPSIRSSVELVHLVAHGRVLLDFSHVQAASRRTAILCAAMAGIFIPLLFLAHRKKQLKRWWRNTSTSRRFFA